MSLLIFIALFLLTAAINFLWPSTLPFSEHFNYASIALGALAAIVTIYTEVKKRINRPARTSHSTPDQISEALDYIAQRAWERLQEESEAHQISANSMIPVSWALDHKYTDNSLVKIKEFSVTTSKPRELLDYIVSEDIYCRLIIIAEGGMGKTTFASQLERTSLISRRKSKDCTYPLLIPFHTSTWNLNKGENILDWIERRLIEEYGNLSSDPERFGPNPARRIINTRSITPVIDGLDELSELHRDEVLSTLSKMTELTYLIMLRPDKIDSSLVRLEQNIDNSIALRAKPLNHQQIVDAVQLIRPAHSRYKEGWESLIGTLEDTRNENLKDALKTPFNIWLFRASFVDDKRDPSPLTDIQKFPQPEDIEEHLYANLLPSLIRSKEYTQKLSFNNTTQVKEWLEYVAHKMKHKNISTIQLWRISQIAGEKPSKLALSLARGLTLGIILFIVGFILSLAEDPNNGSEVAWLGLCMGGIFFSGYIFTHKSRRTDIPPKNPRGGFSIQRLLKLANPESPYFLASLAAASAMGLGFYHIYINYQTPSISPGTPQIPSSEALPISIIFFSIGASIVTFILLRLNLRTTEYRDIYSPWSVLQSDRNTLFQAPLAVASVVAFGALIAILIFFLVYVPEITNSKRTIIYSQPSVSAIFLGSAILISALFVVVFITLLLSFASESSYYTFRVISFAMYIRGRLPLRSITFFREMRDIGVLRTSGAELEFRNQKLLDSLNRQYGIYKKELKFSTYQIGLTIALTISITSVASTFWFFFVRH